MNFWLRVVFSLENGFVMNHLWWMPFGWSYVESKEGHPISVSDDNISTVCVEWNTSTDTDFFTSLFLSYKESFGL